MASGGIVGARIFVPKAPSPTRDVAAPPARKKTSSVHPTDRKMSSPPKRVTFPDHASEKEKVVDADSPRRSSHEPKTSPARSNNASLKSCISAPNLSGMASMKRNVSFHKIEIREYERTLGDNPSVRSGPPIALDWNYNPDHHVFDVDEYEKNKPARSRAEMIMPHNVREDMLKEHWDVSRGEMNAMKKEINITKRNRRVTAVSSESQEKRVAMIQSVSRKMKRIVGSSKKQQEQKLWKDTKCSITGKRVHSMNDLYIVALSLSTEEESKDEEEKERANTSKELLRKESSMSTGDESATSLPVGLGADSDDWGFGFDDDDDEDE